MKPLKAIFIKPEELKDIVNKKGVLLSLAIFILSVILIKASMTLPIFTGKSLPISKIIIGPRDKGSTFIIPPYIFLIVPLISVPILFYFDSFLLLITARLMKVRTTFSAISHTFAYLINIKTLENLILFIIYVITKKYDFGFSLIKGRFDVFSILLVYNLAPAVANDEDEKRRLTIGFFLLYIVLELIFLALVKK